MESDEEFNLGLISLVPGTTSREATKNTKVTEHKNNNDEFVRLLRQITHQPRESQVEFFGSVIHSFFTPYDTSVATHEIREKQQKVILHAALNCLCNGKQDTKSEATLQDCQLALLCLHLSLEILCIKYPKNMEDGFRAVKDACVCVRLCADCILDRVFVNGNCDDDYSGAIDIADGLFESYQFDEIAAYTKETLFDDLKDRLVLLRDRFDVELCRSLQFCCNFMSENCCKLPFKNLNPSVEFNHVALIATVSTLHKDSRRLSKLQSENDGDSVSDTLRLGMTYMHSIVDLLKELHSLQDRFTSVDCRRTKFEKVWRNILLGQSSQNSTVPEDITQNTCLLFKWLHNTVENKYDSGEIKEADFNLFSDFQSKCILDVCQSMHQLNNHFQLKGNCYAVALESIVPHDSKELTTSPTELLLYYQILNVPLSQIAGLELGSEEQNNSLNSFLKYVERKQAPVQLLVHYAIVTIVRACDVVSAILSNATAGAMTSQLPEFQVVRNGMEDTGHSGPTSKVVQSHGNNHSMHTASQLFRSAHAALVHLFHLRPTESQTLIDSNVAVAVAHRVFQIDDGDWRKDELVQILSHIIPQDRATLESDTCWDLVALVMQHPEYSIVSHKWRFGLSQVEFQVLSWIVQHRKVQDLPVDQLIYSLWQALVSRVSSCIERNDRIEDIEEYRKVLWMLLDCFHCIGSENRVNLLSSLISLVEQASKQDMIYHDVLAVLIALIEELLVRRIGNTDSRDGSRDSLQTNNEPTSTNNRKPKSSFSQEISQTDVARLNSALHAIVSHCLAFSVPVPRSTDDRSGKNEGSSSTKHTSDESDTKERYAAEVRASLVGVGTALQCMRLAMVLPSSIPSQTKESKSDPNTCAWQMLPLIHLISKAVSNEVSEPHSESSVRDIVDVLSALLDTSSCLVWELALVPGHGGRLLELELETIRLVLSVVNCLATLCQQTFAHFLAGSMQELARKALDSKTVTKLTSQLTDNLTGLGVLLERTTVSLVSSSAANELSHDELQMIVLLLTSRVAPKPLYNFLVSRYKLFPTAAQSLLRVTYSASQQSSEFKVDDTKASQCVVPYCYDAITNMVYRQPEPSEVSLEAQLALANATLRSCLEKTSAHKDQIEPAAEGIPNSILSSLAYFWTTSVSELFRTPSRDSLQFLCAQHQATLMCVKGSLKLVASGIETFAILLKSLDDQKTLNTLKELDTTKVFQILSINGITWTLKHDVEINLSLPKEISATNESKECSAELCELNQLCAIVEHTTSLLGDEDANVDVVDASLDIFKFAVVRLVDVLHQDPDLVMQLESGIYEEDSNWLSASLSLSFLSLKLPSSLQTSKDGAQNLDSGIQTAWCSWDPKQVKSTLCSVLRQPHQTMIQAIVSACYGLRKLSKNSDDEQLAYHRTSPNSEDHQQSRDAFHTNTSQRQVLETVVNFSHSYLIYLLTSARGSCTPGSVPSEFVKLLSDKPKVTSSCLDTYPNEGVCQSVCASFEMLMMSGSDINVYIQTLLLRVYSGCQQEQLMTDVISTAPENLIVEHELYCSPEMGETTNSNYVSHKLAHDVLEELVHASRQVQSAQSTGKSDLKRWDSTKHVDACASWEKALLQALLRVDPVLLTIEPNALPQYYALLGSVARPQGQIEQLIFLAMGVVDCVMEQYKRNSNTVSELNLVLAAKISLCCIDCTLMMLQGVSLIPETENNNKLEVDDGPNESGDDSDGSTKKKSRTKVDRSESKSEGNNTGEIFSRGGGTSVRSRRRGWYDFSNISSSSGMEAVLGRMLRRHARLSRSDETGVSSNAIVFDPDNSESIPKHTFTVFEEEDDDEDDELEGDQDMDEDIDMESAAVDEGASLEESSSGISGAAASTSRKFQLGERVCLLNPDGNFDGVVVHTSSDGDSNVYDVELESGDVVDMVREDLLRPISTSASKRKAKGTEEEKGDKAKQRSESQDNKASDNNDSTVRGEKQSEEPSTLRVEPGRQDGTGRFIAMMAAAFAGVPISSLSICSSDAADRTGLEENPKQATYYSSERLSGDDRYLKTTGSLKIWKAPMLTNSLLDQYDLLVGKLSDRLELLPRSSDSSQTNLKPSHKSSSQNSKPVFKLHQPNEPKFCTYLNTGRSYQEQHWYHCIDCGLVADKGCCTICAKLCHSGHEIIYARRSRFFCDCGEHDNPSSETNTGNINSRTTSVEANNKRSRPLRACKARGPRQLSRSPSRLREIQQCGTLDTTRSSIGVGTEARKAVLEFLQAAGLLDRMLSAYKWASSIHSSRSSFSESAKNDTLDDTVLSAHTHAEAQATQPMETEVVSHLGAVSPMQRTFLIDQQIFSLWASLESKSVGCVVARTESGANGSEGLDPEIAVVNREKVLSSRAHKQALAITPTGHLCVAVLSTLHVYCTGPLLDNRVVPSAMSHNCTIELSSQCVGFAIASLELNHSQPQLLAVVGLYSCAIVTLGESGEIQDILNLSLGLNEDENVHVIRVLWVPSSPSRMVLVTNAFIRLFDFALDTLCPLRSYTVQDPTQEIVGTTFVPTSSQLLEEKGDSLVGGILLVVCKSGTVYRLPISASSLAETQLKASKTSQLCNVEEEASRMLSSDVIGSILKLPDHAPCEGNPKVGPNGRLTTAISIFFAPNIQRLILSYDDNNTFTYALDCEAAIATDSVSLGPDASNIMVTLELRKHRMNAPCSAWVEWPDNKREERLWRTQSSRSTGIKTSNGSGALVALSSRPGERNGLLLAFRVDNQFVKVQPLGTQLQRKGSSGTVGSIAVNPSTTLNSGTSASSKPASARLSATSSPVRGYCVWNPRGSFGTVRANMTDDPHCYAAPALLVLYEDGSIAKYGAYEFPDSHIDTVNSNGQHQGVVGLESQEQLSATPTVSQTSQTQQPSNFFVGSKIAALGQQTSAVQDSEQNGNTLGSLQHNLDSPVEKLFAMKAIVNESGHILSGLKVAADTPPGPFSFESLELVSEQYNPALYSTLSFSGHVVLKRSAKFVKEQLRSTQNDTMVTGYHRRNLSVDVHLSNPKYCITAIRLLIGNSEGKQVPQYVKVGSQARKVSFTPKTSRWYDVTLTPREVYQANRERFVPLVFGATFDDEAQCIQSIEVYALPVGGEAWKQLMRPIQSLKELLLRETPTPVRARELVSLTSIMEFSISILARYLGLGENREAKEQLMGTKENSRTGDNGDLPENKNTDDAPHNAGTTLVTFKTTHEIAKNTEEMKMDVEEPLECTRQIDVGTDVAMFVNEDERNRLDSCMWEIISSITKESHPELSLNPERHSLRRVAEQIFKALAPSPQVAEKRSDFALLNGTSKLLAEGRGKQSSRLLWEAVESLSPLMSSRPEHVFEWLRGHVTFAVQVANEFLLDWQKDRVIQSCLSNMDMFKITSTVVHLLTLGGIILSTTDDESQISNVVDETTDLTVSLLEHECRLVRMSASCSLELSMFASVNLPLSSYHRHSSDRTRGTEPKKESDPLGSAMKHLESKASSNSTTDELEAAAAVVKATASPIVPNNNPASGAVQYRCDVCQAFPLQGVRWSCGTCIDYDLCSTCKAANVHSEHEMISRNVPDAGTSGSMKEEPSKPTKVQEDIRIVNPVEADEHAIKALSKYARVLVDKLVRALETNCGFRSQHQRMSRIAQFITVLQTLAKLSLPLFQPKDLKLEPLKTSWIGVAMPRYWKLLFLLMEQSEHYFASLATTATSGEQEAVPAPTQRLLLMLQVLNFWSKQLPVRGSSSSSGKTKQSSSTASGGKHGKSSSSQGLSMRRANDGSLLILESKDHFELSTRILDIIKVWGENLSNFSDTITKSLAVSSSTNHEKGKSPFTETSWEDTSMNSADLAMIEIFPHFPTVQVSGCGNAAIAAVFNSDQFAALAASALLESACNIVPCCSPRDRQSLFNSWSPWLLKIVNECNCKELCSTAKYTLLALCSSKQQYRDTRTQSLLGHEMKFIREHLGALLKSQGTQGDEERLLLKYSKSVEVLEALHRVSQAATKYTTQWQAFLVSEDGADVLDLLFNALPELVSPSQTEVLKLLRDAVGSSTLPGTVSNKAAKKSQRKTGMNTKMKIVSQYFQPVSVVNGKVQSRIVLLLDEYMMGSEHPEHRQLTCHTMLRLWANSSSEQQVSLLDILIHRLPLVHCPGLHPFLSVLSFVVNHPFYSGKKHSNEIRETSNGSEVLSESNTKSMLQDRISKLALRFGTELKQALETLDSSPHSMTMRNLSKLQLIVNTSAREQTKVSETKSGVETGKKSENESATPGPSTTSSLGASLRGSMTAVVATQPPLQQGLQTIMKKLEKISDGQACLLCHTSPPPSPQLLQLDKIRKAVSWSSNSMVVELDSVYRLQSIQVDVSRSANHGGILQAIEVYHADMTAVCTAEPGAPQPNALDELKKDWSRWQLVGKLDVVKDPSARIARFQLPLLTKLLRIDYVTAPAVGDSEQAGGKTESLQCPRCSRVVTDKHGVCKHCGEVAFQCRQCRNINYEDLQAFLCVECGYCRFARFVIRVEGEKGAGHPRITTNHGRLAALHQLQVLSHRRAELIDSLRQAKAPIDELASTIWYSLGLPAKAISQHRTGGVMNPLSALLGSDTDASSRADQIHESRGVYNAKRGSPRLSPEDRLRQLIASLHQNRSTRSRSMSSGGKVSGKPKGSSLRFTSTGNRKLNRSSTSQQSGSSTRNDWERTIERLASLTDTAFAIHQEVCAIAVEMKSVHRQIVAFESSNGQSVQTDSTQLSVSGEVAMEAFGAERSDWIHRISSPSRSCTRCAERLIGLCDQTLESFVTNTRAREALVTSQLVTSLALRASSLWHVPRSLNTEAQYMDKSTLSLVLLVRLSSDALGQLLDVIQKQITVCLSAPYVVQGSDCLGSVVRLLCYVVRICCAKATQGNRNADEVPKSSSKDSKNTNKEVAVESDSAPPPGGRQALTALLKVLEMVQSPKGISPEIGEAVVLPCVQTLTKLVEQATGQEGSFGAWYIEIIARSATTFVPHGEVVKSTLPQRRRARIPNVLLPASGSNEKTVRAGSSLVWQPRFHHTVLHAVSTIARFWKRVRTETRDQTDDKTRLKQSHNNLDSNSMTKHWVQHLIGACYSRIVREEVFVLLLLLGEPASDVRPGEKVGNLEAKDSVAVGGDKEGKEKCEQEAEDGELDSESELVLSSRTLDVLDVLISIAGQALNSNQCDTAEMSLEAIHELLDRCGTQGCMYVAAHGGFHYLLSLLREQCCKLIGVEYYTVGDGHVSATGKWVTDSEQGSHAATSAACRLSQLMLLLCKVSCVAKHVGLHFQETLLECFVALKSLHVVADFELELAVTALDSILALVRNVDLSDKKIGREGACSVDQGKTNPGPTINTESTTSNKNDITSNNESTTVAKKRKELDLADVDPKSDEVEPWDGKRAFMKTGAGLLNKLSCKLIQMLEPSTSTQPVESSSESITDDVYFVVTTRSIFSMVRALVDELASVACPVKELPPIYILLQRASSQEEYFRGSIPQNPISIADVKVGGSADSGTTNTGNSGPSASPSLAPSSRSGTSPAKGTNQNEGSQEPTIRDLRAKIAADLNFRDATEIMELIVAGKIMGLDLTISSVFEKVWKPHLLEEAGTDTDRDGDDDSGQSDVDEHDDDGSDAEYLRSDLLGIEQVPPMEVTYRLCGVDGEATEDFVETLDDAPSSRDAEGEKNAVDEFEVMTTFADTLPGATGSGMTAMLGIIQAATSSKSASSFSSEQLRGLLQAALTLFLHCCRVKENREVLLQWDAVPLLLDALMALFHHNKAAKQAEQLLLILEQLVGEANAQGQALGGNNQTRSLALALEQGTGAEADNKYKGEVQVTKKPKLGLSDWPEHSKEQLSGGTSGEGRFSEVGAEDMLSGDNSHLTWFLEQLDNHHKSGTLRDNPQLLRAMARLLPYMTYGRPFAIQCLLMRFAKVVGQDALLALDSAGDREAVCNAAADVRTALGQVLVAAGGIAQDDSGYKLREAALLSGLVPSFVGHIVASATAGTEAKTCNPAGISTGKASASSSKEHVAKDRASSVALAVPLGGGSTKRKSWVKFASLPSLPIVLHLLSGFAKGHSKVQELIASSGALRIVFELERVPDSMVSNVGELADELLTVMRSGSKKSRTEVTKLEHERREAKRKLAMQQRQQTLRKMGLKVVSKKKGKRKTAPGGSSIGVASEELGSATQIVSAVGATSAAINPNNDVNEHQGGNLKRARVADKCAKGKHGKKKKKKAKTFAWMEEVAAMEEEKGVVCTVCQEGYSYKPNEPMGVYVYTRSMALPRGSAVINCEGVVYPPVCAVEQSTEGDTEIAESTSTGSKTPGKAAHGTPKSNVIARSMWGFTTVTSLNCIHLSCHKNAAAADRSHPKAPKDEWEGAELRNSQARCNNLIPLRGPKENITVTSYSRALQHYLQTQNQGSRVSNTGSSRPAPFSIMVHDIRVLLLRIVYKESFSEETMGGGQQSNIKLIVPLMEAAAHLLTDEDTWVSSYRTRSSSSGSGSSSIGDAHGFLYGSGMHSRLYSSGGAASSSRGSPSAASPASSRGENNQPPQPTPKSVNDTLLAALDSFYARFQSPESTMQCFSESNHSNAVRDVGFFAIVSLLICTSDQWEAHKACFVRAAIGFAWWMLDRAKHGENMPMLFGSGALMPKRRSRTMSTDSGMPASRHFSFDERSGGWQHWGTGSPAIGPSRVVAEELKRADEGGSSSSQVVAEISSSIQEVLLTTCMPLLSFLCLVHEFHRVSHSQAEESSTTSAPKNSEPNKTSGQRTSGLASEKPLTQLFTFLNNESTAMDKCEGVLEVYQNTIATCETPQDLVQFLGVDGSVAAEMIDFIYTTESSS